MDWPIPGIRRVSVNCFGFGGTNAHVIMDEANGYLETHGLEQKLKRRSLDRSLTYLSLDPHEHPAELSKNPMPRLFCFSSNEKLGVQRVIDSQVPYVESASADPRPNFLDNYSYTLGSRRSILEWKTAVVASSEEELLSKMKSINSDSFRRCLYPRRPKICYVFCGQGAQWAQMGRELLCYDAFRLSLQAASRQMSACLVSRFSLMDEIMKPESQSRISEPQIAQPATTALQVALVDLMDSLGIRASHVIGHSSGEIAAAYASGSISRIDAWRIAFYRGAAAANIQVQNPKLKGAMIAVEMSEAEAQEYLTSRESSVQIACINSPCSITLSGNEDSVHDISQDLTAKGIFNRVLKVNVAYHSDHMKLVADEYIESLHHIATCSPGVPTMISTLTGDVIAGSELGKVYWEKNMSSPVQYLSAVRQLLESPKEDMPDLILELSPRATLKGPTSDILKEAKNKKKLPRYLSVLDLRVGASVSLLGALAEMWAAGFDFDVEALITGHCRILKGEPLKCLSDVPPYPWNHTRSYWHESHLGKANRFRQYPRQDLIGAPTADSIPFEPRWRGFLRVSENPWIQDHQVQKTIVYPAAGMVAMVLEGAKQMGTFIKPFFLGYEITNMHIEKAMIIPPTEHGLETALNIKKDMNHANDDRLSGVHEFAIYSKQLDGPWEKHATGNLHFRFRDHEMPEFSTDFINGRYQEFSKSCSEPMNPRQLYELLDTVGMNYGQLFQNIQQIKKGETSCVSNIRIPDTKSKMPANFEYPHLIHPGTLDSMFQTLFAIEPVPMVPTFIKSLFVSCDLDHHGASSFSGYSTAVRSGVNGAKADIAMQLDGVSESFVAINGLHLTKITEATPDAGSFLPNHRNLCSEIVWKEDIAFASPSDISEHIELMAHKYPGLAVLQVGGTSSTTLSILEKLTSMGKTPKLSRYTIALSSAEDDAPAMHLLGPTLQSYVNTTQIGDSTASADYHYVICLPGCGVRTETLKKHVKPGGWLVTCQKTPADTGICLSDKEGFLDTEASQEIVATRVPISASTRDPPDVVVLYSQQWPARETSAFLEELIATAINDDVHIKITAVPIEDIMNNNAQYFTGKVVVSILDFTIPSDKAGFIYDWSKEEFEAFHSIQATASGFIWVTRGANMNPSNPSASPVVALARTLISENPQMAFVTLDLSLETSLFAENIAPTILEVFKQTFMEADGPGPKETELSEKDGKIYVPRLMMSDSLNQLIESEGSSDKEAVSFYSHRETFSCRTTLRLAVCSPGLGPDSMHFSEIVLPSLGDGEVLVEFQSGTLSFRDLEVAQGLTTESAVGMDVIGRIKTRGHNAIPVNGNFMSGTRVTALVPPGQGIQSLAIIDGRFVSSLAPEGFVPSFYVSAYYAIVHVGRISGGSRPDRKKTVLIHAAASGFGVAAIRMCQVEGARILATVVGPQRDRQREVLHKIGLPDDQIFDGSSDNACHAVRRATGGKGADVLYSPTQEAMDQIGRCVRSGGTTVQLCDRSSAQVTRAATYSGTFVSLDLAQMMQDDPDFVSKLFHEAVHFVLNRDIDPSPVHENTFSVDFDVGNPQVAFEHIQSSPFLGYARLVGRPKSTVSVPTAETTMPLSDAVDPSGTYVLAGGLGGLGRSMTELLVEAGARNIAFVSRSGASSDSAREFVAGLVDRDINVRVIYADICDKSALLSAIMSPLLGMPPVRGVFQCAAVVKDGVFDNMSYEDWQTAFRPKVLGSENLIEAFTDPAETDQSKQPFFIFLASSSGVIGTRSQANYAAGNCFEDALARKLRDAGRHAVSLDFGPVLGTGMLAEDEAVLDMLRASGFYGIRHQDFLKLIKHAVTGETLAGERTPAQLALGVGTGGLLLQSQPADPYWSRTALWSHLQLVDAPAPASAAGGQQDGSHGRAGPVDTKAMLAASTDVATATDIVTSGLMHMLAKAMNMLFEEMDQHKAPYAYGVDSLVAVSVRNWVFTNCGVNVSVFEVLSEHTIEQLAEMIVERGEFGLMD